MTQTAPTWAVTALGPVPANSAARRDWEHKAAAIAAYREMYGYDHPDDPIGPEPSHQAPGQRAAWHEVFLAAGPPAGPGVRALPEGRLWLLRDIYAAETAWAPGLAAERRDGVARAPQVTGSGSAGRRAAVAGHRPGVHLRRVQGGHPPFHRHADCQHPILPTWDYQLGKSVTLLASYLLNL
jgi:hypothetical protein